MSENTLYRRVDVFNSDRISIPDNKQKRILFSAVIKTNIFLLLFNGDVENASILY